MQLTQSPSDIGSQIRNILLKQQIKGIKVPIKQTNFYHKKIKALNRLYEAPNLDKIRSEGEKKIILVDSKFRIEELELNQYQIKQVELVDCHVQLNYTNLSNQQIFDILKKQGKGEERVVFPNSFETAGHIAHYNLTGEQEKYKEIIGEITLAKCGRIKTVVNKTQKLHNIYRTPVLEYMAGQKNYYVKMKQVGVNFQFDFEKVYWCSRLQKERDRILSLIKPSECLVDLFCGVGPLAVRAAKKGVFVIANDLNPSCYEYLVNNGKINGVEKKMKCWNLCAREAVRKIWQEHNQYEPGFQVPDHFYMNLPVDAIQFLNQFKQYGCNMNVPKMPMIHVNCFVVADSDEKSQELIIERVRKMLPGFKKEEIVSLHHIKNVTVIMRMYCLSFKLRQKYGEQLQAKQLDEEPQIIDRVQKKIKYA